MSKKLTQADIVKLFHRYTVHEGTSSIRVHGSSYITTNGGQQIDLNRETLDMGMLRIAKHFIEDSLNTIRAQLAADEARMVQLNTDLQKVSDLLASQGTSVDENYSNPENVEGG